MDAGKAGSGSPGPEDRAPQADIARSSPSHHVCTHLLPQQRVSYVYALPRSKIRCAGFRPPFQYQYFFFPFSFSECQPNRNLDDARCSISVGPTSTFPFPFPFPSANQIEIGNSG